MGKKLTKQEIKEVKEMVAKIIPNNAYGDFTRDIIFLPKDTDWEFVRRCVLYHFPELKTKRGKTKKIKGLVFKEVEGLMGNLLQAKKEYKNGYGVSVIRGANAYCDSNTYEVAILYKGALCYNTDITDDVLGYQTPTDVEKIMKKVSKLYPKNEEE